MDSQKANCPTMFSYRSSYDSLVSIAFQGSISSYKGKKKIFFLKHI